MYRCCTREEQSEEEGIELEFQETVVIVEDDEDDEIVTGIVARSWKKFNLIK